MSESKADKEKSVTDNLVGREMLHPFDSIDALLEWAANPAPQQAARDPVVKDPVQESHPSIFVKPEMVGNSLPDPISLKDVIKMAKKEFKEKKDGEIPSLPVEEMVFGIQTGEKIKFYQIECKESFFCEKSAIEVILKSINKKMQNRHLKNQFEIMKGECKRQSI